MGVIPFVKRYFFWIVIVFMGIIVSLFGIWGYHIYVTNHSKPHTMFDIVYVTLQLFVLESGHLDDSIPWQFEIARFLAPIIAGWAVIKALTEMFGKQTKFMSKN